MSVKVENLEKSMAKLTVEVEAAEFDKAMVSAYNKTKGRFSLPGFRKGKAPMAMIEKMYGEAVFYDEAVNELLDKTYPDAAKESGLEIVSRPEIGIDQIGKGKSLIYTATVAVKPEVTLGEYKGVEAEKADTEVSAEEVEKRLERELEKNARVVDVEREIKSGDITTIDFVGSVDGVEFSGGRGEDYPLTIGSGTFIPGFEDQLIGHKAGENVDVNVTFPENYGAKDLAGKAALFKVTVKQVKEKQVPAADDEFASEVSEFETLAEYKQELEKQLGEEKAKQAASINEKHVIDKVLENASLEIPAPMLEMQLEQMLYDYSTRLQQQGIPMEQYLQITGLTEENLKEQMKPQAEKTIKTSLVLEAIQKKEGISADDAKLDEEFHRIAEQYKMKYEDLMKTVTDSQRESVRRELSIQATIDMLVSEAKLV
ncbi:trigger factor [Oribacterium sp. oral taxon 102]|uniref:trigger factor n=1 Tax=Oribacterium sp. oral taxon 102 TaxID=671214 RepID=UPI0015B8E3AC|nr:trigger factor [Oribacterium sp. oral taxon 102]NWO21513.1 trigger factor [Oribacterium sp. oral taxon 102]